MAIQYKALCMEMQALLRVRPCISAERNKCKHNLSWYSGACHSTVKYSEAKTFLQTKGVDDSDDQEEILNVMKNLGFIKIYQCQTGGIFGKDYYTENGEQIVLFP